MKLLNDVMHLKLVGVSRPRLIRPTLGTARPAHFVSEVSMLQYSDPCCVLRCTPSAGHDRERGSSQVASMIGPRFSRTLSGLNGTRPVALKLDEMISTVIVC